jgi:hypothetical protein
MSENKTRTMIVDFNDNTITINNQSCSFEEAGLDIPINSKYEFYLNDCDTYLIEKHKDWNEEIEFVFKNSNSYSIKPCYENNELDIISPKTLKHIIDNLSKEEVIRTLVDRIGNMEYSQTYNVTAEAYIDLTDGTINYRKRYPNESSTRENLYVTIFQYNLSNDGYNSYELLGDDDSKFITKETYEKYESNIRHYWEDLSEDVEDDTLRLLKYIDTDFTPEEWCSNILNESISDYNQRESNCDDAFIEGLIQDDYNWMPDFNEDDIYFKPDENDFYYMRKCDCCGKHADTLYVLDSKDIECETILLCEDCVEPDDNIINVVEDFSRRSI